MGDNPGMPTSRSMFQLRDFALSSSPNSSRESWLVAGDRWLIRGRAVYRIDDRTVVIHAVPDDTLVNDRIVNVCGKHQTTPDRTYVYRSLLEPRIDSLNTYESNTFELLYDNLDVLFEQLFCYKTKLLLSMKLGKMTL